MKTIDIRPQDIVTAQRHSNTLAQDFHRCTCGTGSFTRNTDRSPARCPDCGKVRQWNGSTIPCGYGECAAPATALAGPNGLGDDIPVCAFHSAKFNHFEPL